MTVLEQLALNMTPQAQADALSARSRDVSRKLLDELDPRRGVKCSACKGTGVERFHPNCLPTVERVCWTCDGTGREPAATWAGRPVVARSVTA